MRASIATLNDKFEEFKEMFDHELSGGDVFFLASANDRVCIEIRNASNTRHRGAVTYWLSTREMIDHIDNLRIHRMGLAEYNHNRRHEAKE